MFSAETSSHEFCLNITFVGIAKPLNSWTERIPKNRIVDQQLHSLI